jgi:hypothetical protein
VPLFSGHLLLSAFSATCSTTRDVGLRRISAELGFEAPGRLPIGVGGLIGYGHLASGDVVEDPEQGAAS